MGADIHSLKEMDEAGRPHGPIHRLNKLWGNVDQAGVVVTTVILLVMGIWAFKEKPAFLVRILKQKLGR